MAEHRQPTQQSDRPRQGRKPYTRPTLQKRQPLQQVTAAKPLSGAAVM